MKCFLQRQWREFFSSGEEQQAEVEERDFLSGEAFAFCSLLLYPGAGRGRRGMLPKQEAEPNLHPPAEAAPSLLADKELKHKPGDTGTRSNGTKSEKSRGISF